MLPLAKYNRQDKSKTFAKITNQATENIGCFLLFIYKGTLFINKNQILML